MKTFTPTIFNIPTLQGISKESIDQHIELYNGYVKNLNALSDFMTGLMGNPDNNLAIAELHRRVSFEFGGMRLHEYYFKQFEGGAKALNKDSALAKAIKDSYQGEDPQERAIKLMKNIASTRGPGWALLYWDPISKQLLTGFSGEQHMGHFVTLPIILALDVWEHTYILDYGAGGKAKYVEAFFQNLNWSICEENFNKVI